MVEVRRYVTRSGKDVVGDWLAGLRDHKTRARIVARISRLAAGNFGDCKSLREGVFELRVDSGPGYRVYFGRVRTAVVVLLCGGDKRRQANDIRTAIEYWKDYRARTQ